MLHVVSFILTGSAVRHYFGANNAFQNHSVPAPLCSVCCQIIQLIKCQHAYKFVRRNR